MEVLRIACRDDMLAVAHAHVVMQAIRTFDPMRVPELIPVGKGEFPTFWEALQNTLATKTCDLAVHSLQELPTELDPRFPVVAVGRRQDPREALVVPIRHGEPNRGKPLGVSNRRRLILAQELHANWPVKIVQGDILTRLAGVDAGLFGGMIVPAGALKALRQPERIYEAYPVEQFMPASGQGMVALQGRAGEPVGYLAGFHCVDTWDMALAERAFVKVMKGDAMSAAHATLREEILTVRGIWIGPQRILRAEMQGRRRDAAELGAGLAARLLYMSRPPRQTPGGAP